MQFKGFTLDPFQEKSINHIQEGNSVIVSAATGTGKTLIAEYLIDTYIGKKRRIIYTAPIKALSNQKFRDFKEEYGEEHIGIMTGDVVINPTAMVLIMTTEIFRNMLLAKDEIIDYVDYVVFDEIHYINDIERGTIWEESIIFSPDRLRFLCLSATIPNADEFADWISTTKNHPVKVVTYEKRAVPLKHFFYDVGGGIVDRERLKLELETPDYKYVKGNQRSRKKASAPRHEDLVRSIQNNLPALFFVFSRAQCEKKASQLARKKNFLKPQQQRDVSEFINSLVNPEFRSLESVRLLKEVLSKGIGFHHAGLLPQCKEAVEKLFAKGLVKVLYCTETFAVGINYPAKSVCFSSLMKYDGINFRYLFTKEYFQMAGRAGRRGIDKIGYVYVMYNRRSDDFNRVMKITDKDIEPIKSQYRLSYNTVLNLINNYEDDATREIILKSSFDYYQMKKKANVRIMARFNNIRKKLRELGFIKDNKLTKKGHFAKRIYESEILVTNLFTSELYKHLSEDELNVIIATVIYEEGKNDKFEKDRQKRLWKGILAKVNQYTDEIDYIDKRAMKKLSLIISDFTNGVEFSDITQYTNLAEGDIIRLFRRMIDMLRQIRHATEDVELQDKIGVCINKIQRPPIKVEF